MRRVLPVAAVLCLMALTTASCGGVEGVYAARVNRSVISEKSVYDVLKGLPASQQAGGVVPGSYSTQAVAGVLTFEIQAGYILPKLAQRMGLTASDQEVQNAMASPPQGLDPSKLPNDFLERFARGQVLQQKIGNKLGSAQISDATVAAAVSKGPQDFAKVCIHVIATQDQATAQDAAKRIASGEPFETVASDPNVNPQLAQNKGQVPCQLAGALGLPDLTQALAGLRPGGVTPVLKATTQQGDLFLIARLDSAAPAGADEQRQLVLQQQVNVAQLVSDAVRREASNFQVVVNPRFGEWHSSGPQAGSVTPLVAPTSVGDEPPTTAPPLGQNPSGEIPVQPGGPQGSAPSDQGGAPGP